jgi:hypothetical protein
MRLPVKQNRTTHNTRTVATPDIPDTICRSGFCPGWSAVRTNIPVYDDARNLLDSFWPVNISQKMCFVGGRKLAMKVSKEVMAEHKERLPQGVIESAALTSQFFNERRPASSSASLFQFPMCFRPLSDRRAAPRFHLRCKDQAHYLNRL